MLFTYSYILRSLWFSISSTNYAISSELGISSADLGIVIDINILFEQNEGYFKERLRQFTEFIPIGLFNLDNVG